MTVLQGKSSAGATPVVTIRLEPELRAELARLAKSNDRTISAEIRMALRGWLADAQAAA